MIKCFSTTKDIPEGFIMGKCKCGNEYAYCGMDIGCCVECLDKLEIEDDKK